MPSLAVIPSQISDEADEYLDPEESKEISRKGSGENRELVSFGLNLKSTPLPSFRGHHRTGRSVFLNI